VTIDENINRPFSRRQFIAGAAGAAAGLGAASLLNSPIADAAVRRSSSAAKSALYAFQQGFSSN
jgi:hypothetical protein